MFLARAILQSTCSMQNPQEKIHTVSYLALFFDYMQGRALKAGSNSKHSFPFLSNEEPVYPTAISNHRKRGAALQDNVFSSALTQSISWDLSAFQ